MANDNIDPRLMQSIVQQESSGRPTVIGDAGESIGLMQIQKETARGLYKQGLLPKKWEGKNVKKKDLPKLLENPDFNKLAGAALYVDNKQRIRRVAKKNGIQLTPDQLNDMAIKAHNQGVTKTINRELLGKEETLPTVDAYLKNVKSRIQPLEQPIEAPVEQPIVQPTQPVEVSSLQPTAQPSFQEGGLVDGFVDDNDEFGPFDREPPQTVAPAAQPIEQPIAPVEEQDDGILDDIDKDILTEVNANEQDLQSYKTIKQMDNIDVQKEYQDILNEYKDASQSRNEAKKKQVLLKVVEGLSKFGAQYAAGGASAALGAEVRAPAQTYKAPTLDEMAPGPDVQALKGKLSLLKQLQGKQKKASKYSMDADDGASVRARANLESAFGIKVPDTWAEHDVESRGHLLVNRNPTEFKLAQAASAKELARTRIEESKAKRKETDARHQAGVRMKDEKAVRDISEKLAGLKGARSVYAKSLLRETLSRDGLRVIESIRKGKFVPSEQIAEELATVMASTLQGGNQATRDAIHGLIPSTIAGDANSIKQYLMGSPETYLNKEFIQHFEEQLIGQRDYWKENLTGTQRKMYTTLQPIFTRKDKEGVAINEDLRDLFQSTMDAPEAPQQKAAPYGDEVEKDGKKYKWNATKGKYQLVK
jgi:hypothetical protein